MMKYVATAAVAATFTASAALAGGAIQPIMEAQPQVVYVAPATGWTGGYVGGNLSFGKGKVKGPAISETPSRARAFAVEDLPEYIFDGFVAKPDGTSGAIRAGYDWQRGAGVFGVGAEYNFGKYKDSIDVYDESVNIDIKNAATIFARAGYAMSDNFMAYGLVGYTWAKGTASWAGDSASADLDGGTIGLGAEYKFNSKWSTYGEYTYTDFGKVDGTGGLVKATLGQAKLGVNYRF